MIDLVLGKFLAAWSFAALALALTFPVWLTVSYLGNPDHGVIAAGYVGSVLLSGGFLAVGSAVSAVSHNQVVAFVLSVAACFFLLLTGWGPVQSFFNGWLPPAMSEVMASISFMSHFVDSFVRGVMIVLLVVLINALAGNVLRSARIDLTQEKLYSLSPAVGPFLKGLDEPIDIQLFISRDALTNLPVYRAYATRVEEFLSEMQRVSDGKINLTVLNPEPFSEAEDLARTMGLQQGNTGRAGENLVLGVVLTNTVDHREVLPFLSPAEEPTLEYDLMRAISGLAKPKKPLLGLITALPMAGSPPRPGKNDPGKPPYAAGAQMEKLFRVLQIDRLADKLPEGLDALVMVHPAGLSDNLLRGIDTYVHQGGRVALFFDPQHESRATPSGFSPKARARRARRCLAGWGSVQKPCRVTHRSRAHFSFWCLPRRATFSALTARPNLW